MKLITEEQFLISKEGKFYENLNKGQICSAGHAGPGAA